jgi:hypothetical protein
VTAVVSLAGLVGLFVLPWDRWLPGMAVVPVDADWLTRNSPFITLVGAILALVTLVGPLVLRGIRAERAPVKKARTSSR